MRLRITVLDSLLVYVVVIGGILLAWNHLGGDLIQAWYAEYVGDDGQFSGSGAWRGDDGRAFYEFALTFGTWVYPLASITSVGYLRRAWRADTVSARVRACIAAALGMAVLSAFVWLGVFGSVTRD